MQGEVNLWGNFLFHFGGGCGIVGPTGFHTPGPTGNVFLNDAAAVWFAHHTLNTKMEEFFRCAQKPNFWP